MSGLSRDQCRQEQRFEMFGLSLEQPLEHRLRLGQSSASVQSGRGLQCVGRFRRIALGALQSMHRIVDERNAADSI